MFNQDDQSKTDEEFDSLLLQIKPYVMGMVDRHERQRCASWIKKLCQYSEASSWEKKNRNTYSQLLFHMLKRGGLDYGVFAGNPPEGPLEPMSASSVEGYMNSNGIREKSKSPISGFTPAIPKSRTPNWVETELNDTTVTNLAASTTGIKRSSSLRYDSRNSPQFGTNGFASGYNFPTEGRNSALQTLDESQQLYDYNSSMAWKYNMSSSQGNRPSSSASAPISRHGHLEEKENSGVRGASNAAQTMVDEAKRQSLQKFHEREMESQKKLYDAKLLDEKKALEAQYERELKRLVEKKNEEVEMTHSQYRKKISELESKTKELADKLTSLTQEADSMKRGKDRQIAEIKNLAHSNLETLQKEYESKITSLNTQFEDDRERLEQAHADSIQELIDDTNKRLQKMEHEYSQQQATTAKLVEELESRINSLTADSDRTREEKFDLERRNMELEYECRTLNDGFLELKSRLEKFEHKYVDTVDSMRKDKQETVSKYESNCESLKKTHAEKVDELMQKICEMDDRMLEMKQKLQDTNLEFDRNLKETQNNAKTELLSCQQGYEKKLKELQLNYDLDVKELQSKLARSDECVSEKDTEIEKLMELHKREMVQSQAAFDKFRKQVDISHNKVYEEMRRQIERIESDLTESKSIREQQAAEYEKTVNALRLAHEKSTEELRVKQEEEKANWLKELAQEREQMISKHDESLENLRVKLEQRIASNEIAHKTELKKREKYLSDVEVTRDKLREEILEAEATRKQQLMEVGLKMEQLRTKFNSDRELIAAKCRAVADAERKDYVDKHEQEMKELLLRNAEKETQIESDFRAKLKNAEENNAQLQTEIETWRNEAFREQQEHESKIEELMKRKNTELTKMRNENTQKVNNVINDLESTQFKVKSLEKRLIERESHYEHEMNQLVLTHNSKMKTMLPASVRQELEATIESLKSQVHSLQQTVLILQSGSGNIRNSPLHQTANNQKAKLSSMTKWNHDKERSANNERDTIECDSNCKDIL